VDRYDTVRRNLNEVWIGTIKFTCVGDYLGITLISVDNMGDMCTQKDRSVM